MAKKKKRVLLLIETSREYGRGIISGVTQYVKEHENWNIYFEDRGLNEPKPVHFRYWDGIISRSPKPEDAVALRNSGVPFVELLSTDRETHFPEVMGDSVAIGEVAIEHFLECHLKHFAYFSLFNTWWSVYRSQVFAESLTRRGYSCSIYNASDDNNTAHPSPMVYWNRNFGKGLPQWLVSLPKPTGLLVTTDSYAMYVFEACHSLGIAIPEEIAILGIDNDSLFCNALNPQLSSIDQNSKLVGYYAAEILDKKMKHRFVARDPIFTPPAYVVSRKSTDIVNIDDEDVIYALRFIRENISERIDVHDLVGELNLSRSTLERRFRQSLGTSPSEEIKRCQMNRAKELLRESDQAISKIAFQCGFTETDYFIRTFRRTSGKTPSQYRALYQFLPHDEHEE